MVLYAIIMSCKRKERGKVVARERKVSFLLSRVSFLHKRSVRNFMIREGNSAVMSVSVDKERTCTNTCTYRRFFTTQEYRYHVKEGDHGFSCVMFTDNEYPLEACIIIMDKVLNQLIEEFSRDTAETRNLSHPFLDECVRKYQDPNVLGPLNAQKEDVKSKAKAMVDLFSAQQEQVKSRTKTISGLKERSKMLKNQSDEYAKLTPDLTVPPERQDDQASEGRRRLAEETEEKVEEVKFTIEDAKKKVAEVKVAAIANMDKICRRQENELLNEAYEERTQSLSLNLNTFQRKAPSSPGFFAKVSNSFSSVRNRVSGLFSTEDRSLELEPLNSTNPEGRTLDPDLVRVLQKRHLLQHEGTFVQHRVYDIETLVELNEGHLKEMGFTAVGDRANILGAIKDSRKELSITAEKRM